MNKNKITIIIWITLIILYFLFKLFKKHKFENKTIKKVYLVALYTFGAICVLFFLCLYLDFLFF